MRKVFFVILLIMGCLTAGMLSSCRKSVTSGNYYELIPASSSFVCAVNINQLMKKSEAEELLQKRLPELLGKDTDAAVLSKLQQILKDGNQSGLDLSDYVYVFTGSGEVNVGLVAKVADKAKLKETFSCVEKQSGCTPLTETDGYQQTIVGDNMICMFNDRLMLCVIADEVAYGKEYATRLLSRKDTATITTEPCFAKLLEGKSDFKMFFSMQHMPEAIKARMTMSPVDYSQICVIGRLNFDKGSIKLVYEMAAKNPAALKKLEEQSDYIRKISDTFLSYYPASAVLLAAYNCEGEGLSKMLNENDFWQQIPQANRVVAEKVLNALNGDITYGVTEFSPMGIPAMLLCARVKDTYPADALAVMLKENMQKNGILTEKGKHVYEFNAQMLNLTVYFGVKDGSLFYLTNDEKAYRHIGQPVKDAFVNSPVAAGLKKSLGGVVVDFESLTQSPVIAMLLYQTLGTQQGALALKVLSGFSYMEILNTDKTTVEWSLYLKDKEQNSLKSLIRIGDELSALN